MQRGFGIDAGIAPGIAGEVARRAEQLGYGSFWVNGSPPDAALAGLEAASRASSLELGVGVIPLTQMAAVDIVDAVSTSDIDPHRLWLGVGSSRNPGGLAEVRDAVTVLRRGLGVHVATGAVGPRMTRLAGEISDAVVFTWWTAADVGRSRPMLEEGAAATGRPAPPIVSFIRCALVPEAGAAVADRAARYQAIPRYAEIFARNAMTAADTVVTGADRSELAPGIAREEAPVDIPVVRAIPADDSTEAVVRLLEACAPVERGGQTKS